MNVTMSFYAVRCLLMHMYESLWEITLTSYIQLLVQLYDIIADIFFIVFTFASEQQDCVKHRQW